MAKSDDIRSRSGAGVHGAQGGASPLSNFFPKGAANTAKSGKDQSRKQGPPKSQRGSGGPPPSGGGGKITSVRPKV